MKKKVKDRYYMKVAFHEETLDAAQAFRQKLNALSEKVNLGFIRLYIKHNVKDPTISDDLYKEADEIFKLRSEAISKEAHAHAVAQANIAGVEIPEEILNGKSLEIGFKKEITEKVPTLKVYELFMPYTLKELEEWKKNKLNPDHDLEESKMTSSEGKTNDGDDGIGEI